VRCAWLAACALGCAAALPAAAATHAVHRWLHWSDALAAAPPELAAALGEPRDTTAPAAGYVDLLRRIEITIDADGAVLTRQTLLREFSSDDGVRGFGNLMASARAELDELELRSAFVRQPDGNVASVDPRTIQVITRAEAEVFSDVWDVVVPLPDLRPGSRGVLVTESRTGPGRWPFHWSRLSYLGDIGPIRRAELVVRWRDGAPPPRHVTNDPALRCTAGATEIVCVRDDVPAVESDPDVESYWDLLPHVVFTREPAWATLRDRVEALVADAAAGSPALATQAARLVAGSETPRERAERLARFVADEIRYVGLEHGVDGVLPAAAAVTLERRYGDCKGKVALLLALAREAGLAGRPVLVATHLHATAHLLAPSAAYFDHMIACLELGEERTWCVDPTAADLPTHLLPEGVSDAVALATHDGMELVQLAGTPFARELRLDASNRILCDGQIEETLTRTYQGHLALRLRDSLKPLTTERRHSEIVASYREVVGESTDPTPIVRDLDEPLRPVSLETVTDFPGAFGPEASFYREPEVWLAHYLEQLTTANRVHPYRFPGLDYRTRHVYELCSGWSVPYHGPTLDLETRWGTLSRRYEIAGSRVTVDTRVLIPRRLLVGEERAEMNAFLGRLVDESRIWFRVRRPD
jgi:transglutaminase-like putative cysteine protease